MTIRAVYDGEVFRPTEPLDLPPDTEVEVTLPTDALARSMNEPLVLTTLRAEGPDSLFAKTGKPYSFLDILESVDLEGPPDWSSRFHEYLYGPWAHGDEDEPR